MRVLNSLCTSNLSECQIHILNIFNVSGSSVSSSAGTNKYQPVIKEFMNYSGTCTSFVSWPFEPLNCRLEAMSGNTNTFAFKNPAFTIVVPPPV